MATILDLLMALNRGDLPSLPNPAKPVPMPLPVGAPSLTVMPPGAPPDLPPTAPLPPLDTNLINQLAGPEPVAPTFRAPSTLDKIAAVLSGAALGPQYGAQLREERERPIREYNAAVERYQGRRAQGVEFATRKQERDQDRAQQRAEDQSRREFELYLKRSNVTDELAQRQMREAHELHLVRERERAQDERDARQQQAAKEKQRNDIFANLVTKEFAPQKFANEIADAIVFGKPMSAAAERWRSVKARKLEAQLANIGGGGGGGDTLVEIVDPMGNVLLGPLPYGKVKFDNGEPQGFPGATIRRAQGRGPTTAPTVSGASPEGFPLALGAVGGPKPYQAAAQGPSDEDVKAYAKRFKMSPKKARAELMGQ